MKKVKILEKFLCSNHPLGSSLHIEASAFHAKFRQTLCQGADFAAKSFKVFPLIVAVDCFFENFAI